MISGYFKQLSKASYFVNNKAILEYKNWEYENNYFAHMWQQINYKYDGQ